MHGLVAARLGDSEMALRYFRQTAAIDLADTHVAIDGGMHIAALGGIWHDGGVRFRRPVAAQRRRWRSTRNCRRVGAASASAFSGVAAASRSGSTRASSFVEATLEAGEPMTLARKRRAARPPT